MLDTLFAVGVGVFTTLTALRFFRHGMPFVLGVLATFLFEGFYNHFEFHLVVFYTVLVLLTILTRFTAEPMKTWSAPVLAGLVAAFEGHGGLWSSVVGLGGVAVYAVVTGMAHARAKSAESREALMRCETTVLACVLGFTFILTKSPDMYLFMLYAAPLTGFLLFRRMPAPWVVSSVMLLNFAFLARALQ